ncbi:MAG: 50S ribosomal protein L9 [Thermoanaerobacteraceae bacterium]|nr:50S ribosomal protein L9 [Thermoanaerobacteraceae bacterium]
MKVILKQDVKKLGRKGDVVEVSDGYARNFLLPKGLAEEATSGNMKELKKMKKAEQRRYQEEVAAAEQTRERLAASVITIKAKAGDNGKLFGSVTSKDIAEAIKNELGIKIDKRKIELDDPIKSLGSYNLKVKIHPEVHGKVTVKVTAQ